KIGSKRTSCPGIRCRRRLAWCCRLRHRNGRERRQRLRPQPSLISPSSRASERLFPTERLRLSACQQPVAVDPPEEFDQFRHHAGPSGLVAGADPRAVVAMEILEEQETVAPVRICLKSLRSSIHRSPPGFVTDEDADQPIGNLAANLEKVHPLA